MDFATFEEANNNKEKELKCLSITSDELFLLFFLRENEEQIIYVFILLNPYFTKEDLRRKLEVMNWRNINNAIIILQGETSVVSHFFRPRCMITLSLIFLIEIVLDFYGQNAIKCMPIYIS